MTGSFCTQELFLLSDQTIFVSRSLDGALWTYLQIVFLSLLCVETVTHINILSSYLLQSKKNKRSIYF